MSDTKKSYDEEFYNKLVDIFQDAANFYATDDASSEDTIAKRLVDLYDTQRKTFKQLDMPNPLAEMLLCFAAEALDEGECPTNMPLRELLGVIAKESDLSEDDAKDAAALIGDDDALLLTGTSAQTLLEEIIGMDDATRAVIDELKKKILVPEPKKPTSPTN